jgi:hypothetical protein
MFRVHPVKVAHAMDELRKLMVGQVCASSPCRAVTLLSVLLFNVAQLQELPESLGSAAGNGVFVQLVMIVVLCTSLLVRFCLRSPGVCLSLCHNRVLLLFATALCHELLAQESAQDPDLVRAQLLHTPLDSC